MDGPGQVGQLSPFILRSCFVLVFAGLLFWHVSVLHPSTTPAKTSTEAPSSFSTPRTLYSGKRIIAFDWNLVHGLAHQRISHLENLWETTDVQDGSVAKGCSTLYPSHSPASSCWQDGAGLQEQPVPADSPKKPIQVKVSFLEVPQGETAHTIMTKRMQQAVDQATIDAQTEAISKGLSGTQAQQYAEAHRQQLLMSNPQELAAQHLPTFDLEDLDLPSLLPQMLGDADNSGPLVAFSGLIRELIEQMEATISVLSDDEDEYEEPSLEESAAEHETIDRAYRNIVDTLPVNLHGQPGCPLAPRLAPIPLNISNTPWLPVLKQLFSEIVMPDSDGSSTAAPSTGSTRDTHAGGASEGTLGAQASDGMHSSFAKSSSTTRDTATADVSDAWTAGTAVQKKIEVDLHKQLLPAPAHTADYAKRRLQEVSAMSRRLDDQYHELFRQRMLAKQLLHERQRSEAEAYFRSPEFAEQLNRLLSITRFAMAPVSDEHVAISHLWRDLVYMATLQTRAVACMSAGGQDVQCYQQAFASRPAGYAGYEALTQSQQQEFRGELQRMFNASVTQPPVRLPVLHWDERIDGTAREQKVNLHSAAASDAEAANLWTQGRGEPRQDAWQVMEAITAGLTDDRDQLSVALHAQAVQNYLQLQMRQMLTYIQQWSDMMEPEDIKEVILEWRSKHPQVGLPSHDAGRATATSEELLAQLRAKLMTRSEEEGRQADA